MGGDTAPKSEVAGALAAVRDAPVDVILVGDEATLAAELDRLGASDQERLHIQHAGEVVTMDDHPGQVFRRKRDSSMRVAFDLVAAGRASAVVSAGNSGAMLSHGLFVLKRCPGIDRPGIVTALPTPRGQLVLCDVGANVEVKPRMLAQFAIIGAAYARVAHGVDRPRVGVLSNGTEESKGTELTREASGLLRDAAAHAGALFDYVGYVEGLAVFDGDVDVIATDGFTGNAVLKASEGLAEAVMRMVKGELQGALRERVDGDWVMPVLAKLKRTVDYRQQGGALLAGVQGVVMICHGRSDGDAIKNAIKSSVTAVEGGFPDQIASSLQRLEMA